MTSAGATPPRYTSGSGCLPRSTRGSLPFTVEFDHHGFCEITTTDDTRVLHTLTGWALDRGVTLEGLVATRPSLEDTYLALVGDSAPDAPAELEPATTAGATR